jgi:hypothetical protein
MLRLNFGEPPSTRNQRTMKGLETGVERGSRDRETQGDNKWTK